MRSSAVYFSSSTSSILIISFRLGVEVRHLIRKKLQCCGADQTPLLFCLCGIVLSTSPGTKALPPLILIAQGPNSSIEKNFAAGAVVPRSASYCVHPPAARVSRNHFDVLPFPFLVC